MSGIDRNPESASRVTYDLIVIGGGVHGIMLSMEAARRGLRSLLLEKGDFGAATSTNSLRIAHGGLRYLQSADLKRFYESVGERRWLLEKFPYLVRPMPCLMPLYGKGLYRPSIFRIALLVNDALSRGRNSGLPRDRRIPGGKVIDPAATEEIFNGVDRDGLVGGAIWYDALIPDPQRLLMDTIRWSCGRGSTFLNYVEAVRLKRSGDRLEGVEAIDHVSGRGLEFKSNIVVNAAGPWARDIAARFHKDIPKLFRSSLAWNVLFNGKALSDHALAVAPKRVGSRIYFLIPWKGMLLAGTGHAPRESVSAGPVPTEGELREFIDDLNLAVPGIGLERGDILHIFAGFLPVTETGGIALTKREVFIDHGTVGGPGGLYSLTGIKFTTSRLAAEKSLRKIFPKRGGRDGRGIEEFNPAGHFLDGEGMFDFHWIPDSDDLSWRDPLRRMVKEESVCHLGDLVYRRTNIGDNPERAAMLAPRIAELFDWDESRAGEEMRLLRDSLQVDPVGEELHTR